MIRLVPRIAPIVVTENAWMKIRDVLGNRKEYVAFLFSAEGGGCNGFNYSLGAIKKDEVDEIIAEWEENHESKWDDIGFKFESDPQIKWLKTELFDWAHSVLSDSKTYNDGIYDTKKLVSLFEKFKDNSSLKNSNLFWQAICIKKMLINYNPLVRTKYRLPNQFMFVVQGRVVKPL